MAKSFVVEQWTGRRWMKMRTKRARAGRWKGNEMLSQGWISQAGQASGILGEQLGFVVPAIPKAWFSAFCRLCIHGGQR